jgi:D-alanyl-D-alanine carboxypeptidase (penicillin-binding protein 5/6)
MSARAAAGDRGARRPGGGWRLAVGALGLAAALAGAPPARAAAAGPQGLVPARALLLFERDTGTVVWARNANAELPIASLTKIMTAYVTEQVEKPSAVLTEQPYKPSMPPESLAKVPAGTRLSVSDMLRAMLLPSGNDVANSLAIDVGGSVPRFVALMNAWASVLRLGRTHYTTAIGLDRPPGNYSTAYDLARLGSDFMADPLLRAIVDLRAVRIADGQVIRNREGLIGRYAWLVGIKTGTTDNALYCMVGAARLHGVHLISVVLGARTPAARDADTLALLRYGLARFRSVVIARRGQRFGTLRVRGRPHRRVAAVAATGLRLVLDRSVRVHAALRLPARVTGPLPAGARLGRIVVTEDGKRHAVVGLVAARAVPAPPPAAQRRRRTWVVWALIGGGGLVAALLGCSLTFMLRRRARRSAVVAVPE